MNTHRKYRSLHLSNPRLIPRDLFINEPSFRPEHISVRSKHTSVSLHNRWINPNDRTRRNMIFLPADWNARASGRHNSFQGKSHPGMHPQCFLDAGLPGFHDQPPINRAQAGSNRELVLTNTSSPSTHYSSHTHPASPSHPPYQSPSAGTHTPSHPQQQSKTPPSAP
jgi:hypothetical protein